MERTNLLDDPQIRRLVLVIGWMIVIAGAAWAMTLAWPVISTFFRVVAPFLVALVLAYLFNPIVTFFQKRLHLSRVAGVVFVNLVLLAIAGLVVAIIIPILSTQVRAAWQGTSQVFSTRFVPYFYEQMGLETEPESARMLTLETQVAEWAGSARQTATTRDEQVHIDRLETVIAEWTEANPVRSIQTGARPASDLHGLTEMTEKWIEAHALYMPENQEKPELEQLATLVEDWTAARRDFEAGNLRPVDLDELEARAREKLAAQGIDMDAALAEFRDGEGVGVVAGSGLSLLGWIGRQIVQGVMWLIESTIFIVFVLLMSFYLLLDFSKLRNVAAVMVPEKWSPRFFDVLGKVDVAVGGFIRGQTITATIVGIIATVGLWILGLKQYALLIGVITGVGNLIPYLGPIMGATPALLYVLMSESYEGLKQRLIYLALVLGLFVMINMIEGFVLQPKIVGKAASLHPIVVILALAMGAVFGIMGMILALPVAAALRVLLKEFYWDAREAAAKARGQLEA